MKEMNNPERVSFLSIVTRFLTGIYLSSVLFTCVCFPSLSTDVPSVTSEAFPVNGVSVFLETCRIVFCDGYGLLPSVAALLIFLFLQKNHSSIRTSSYYGSHLIRVISLVFGILNTFGLCMYHLDYLPCFHGFFGVFFTLYLTIGLGIVFFYAVCFLLQLFDASEISVKENVPAKTSKKYFWQAFIVIIVFWLPWIIAYFPASMDNDVFSQLYSWMYEPSNSHPWFSTCFIGFFFNLGLAVKNENLGIFLFVMVRAVIVAAVFAKSTCLVMKIFPSRILRILSVAFFAVTPVWGAYSKHAFKDTLAIGLFCLYMMCLADLMLEYESTRKISVRSALFYALSSLLAALSRNNFILAILPATVVIVIFCLVKKQKALNACCTLTGVILYFVLQAVISLSGVKSGSAAEIISVPMQQTARTVKYHYDSISDEEYRGISGMFIPENMPSYYDPILADPIKGAACLLPREERRDGCQTDYIKTWFKMMFEYPDTYIEAAVAQGYAYYAFTPRLPEQSGNWNSGMTIFDWIGSNSDFDEQYDFHYIGLFDDIRQILQTWWKVWDKIPLLCITDVCAFYTWSLILFACRLIIRKKKIYLITICPLLIMSLSCTLAPVNDCFRYFAPVAASFPVMIAVILHEKYTESKNMTIKE